MLNITPTSQISHLKAWIFAEVYDHILNFRRQMYIKYDDMPKIPGSLLINANELQFRIFLIDDKITCFNCKSTGYTSSSCKKVNSNNMEISSPPHQINCTEINYTPENQNTNLIENSQLLYNTTTPMILDKTPPNCNDTEITACKRQPPLDQYT